MNRPHARSLASFEATTKDIIEGRFSGLIRAAIMSALDVQMSVEFPGDRDYGEAGTFDPEPFFKMAADARPEFTTTINSFRRNLTRMAAMHSLPIDLIFHSTRQAHMTFRALDQLGISKLDPTPDHLIETVTAQINRLNSEELARISGDEMQRRAVEFGHNQIKELNRRQMSGLGGIDPEHESNADFFLIGGMDSIFAAMISGVYAAFETFAADLWIALVNCEPRLALAWARKNKSKSLTFAEIAGENFDLTQNMGTILTRCGKVNFQTLDSVRANYVELFGEDATACLEPFREILVVSKVRHLLAHRGGQIDAKFLSEVGEDPSFTALGVGDYIRFDGGTVRSYIDICILRAAALLKLAKERTGDG